MSTFISHQDLLDDAIVGGGTYQYTGEIPLRHYGVLFQDESPEFKWSVLEVVGKEMVVITTDHCTIYNLSRYLQR